MAAMETSLHRELKGLYAERPPAVEVRLGDYRIDAVAGDELVEIQHGSLAALRVKVGKLLATHRVRVVKPIVAHKLLVKQDGRGGPVVERRMSPKRGTLLDMFDDLVYFVRVFPHPRLSLDVLLVDVEEWRYPGHGRRRRWRGGDFQIEDQKLVRVLESHTFRTAADLRGLIACRLPRPFDTAQLAVALSVRRVVAQRVAYCLRETGAALVAGKRGASRLYRFAGADQVKPQRRAG